MNDKATLSAELIALSHINPLLAGGSKVGVVDTIDNVRSVIEAMGDLMIDQTEEPTDSMNRGLYLINRWLSLTLKFVNEHPKVENVAPVVEGGTS